MWRRVRAHAYRAIIFRPSRISKPFCYKNHANHAKISNSTAIGRILRTPSPNKALETPTVLIRKMLFFRIFPPEASDARGRCNFRRQHQEPQGPPEGGKSFNKAHRGHSEELLRTDISKRNPAHQKTGPGSGRRRNAGVTPAPVYIHPGLA